MISSSVQKLKLITTKLGWDNEHNEIIFTFFNSCVYKIHMLLCKYENKRWQAARSSNAYYKAQDSVDLPCHYEITTLAYKLKIQTGAGTNNEKS